MKRFRMLRVVVAIMVMLACTATCFESAAPAAVEAASAKINYSKKTLYVGRTVKLKIKYSKTSYTWTSSNSSVAKVASNGTVTALKKGSATITATSASGKSKFTCKVTVKNPYVLPKDVKVLMPGQTLQLSVKGGTPVKYTSSDPKIAKVDATTGLVTAVKGSDYYVTISVKCDNGKTYKRNVCVIDLGFDSGDTGSGTGSGNDSGKKKYLTVPSIASDSYGLFNPQKKMKWEPKKTYEISTEAEFAKACKEAMDMCNEEFAVHNLNGTAENLHDMFLKMTGKYSILANRAGYLYIQGNYDENNPNSFENITEFDFKHADDPNYEDLFAVALIEYMETRVDKEGIFILTTEIFRPIYSYASQASAYLRYDGYPAGSEAKRVLKAATGIVEEAIKKSTDLTEVIENINNKICEMTTYDTATDADKSTLVEKRSDGRYQEVTGRDATGIIDNGLGVCMAYASLFSLCMDILGVPNEYVCNKADTHVWNRIYVDGTWYHVDVTWNDTSRGNVYFMLKDDEISGVTAKYSPSKSDEHDFYKNYLSK